MSTDYYLVNHTKKQIVSFANLPVATIKEITGNSVASAVVTWYLYENQSDHIEFVSEHDEQISHYLNEYTEMTHPVILSLISAQILTENTPVNLYVFEDSEEDRDSWYWNIGLKN